MAVTGRLSRALYPKWVTTKPVELSLSTNMEHNAGEEAAARMLSPGVSSEVPETAASSVPAVSRLRALLRLSVASASRHIMSGQAARASRKSGKQDHSIAPGQSFVDAISEWNASINQYYGVASNPSVAEVEPTDSESVKKPTTSKAATIASRKARIIEAKQNRLSVADSRHRAESLTLNVLAPSIGLASRMSRLGELCDHVKQDPSSRLTAINVSKLIA